MRKENFELTERISNKYSDVSIYLIVNVIIIETTVN